MSGTGSRSNPSTRGLSTVRAQPPCLCARALFFIFLRVVDRRVVGRQDMVNDCKENNQKRNDDPSVKAWDEAWAFYAGSLEVCSYGLCSHGLCSY